MCDNNYYKIAVITMSDRASKGEGEDISGPLIIDITKNEADTVLYKILPDSQYELESILIDLCDNNKVDIIFTTGGTGFSLRDVTPEATLSIAEKLVPGIQEAIRARSMQITSRAMLSRAVSVIRKKTLIINLPGSPKAVKESLELILPTIWHGVDVLKGDVLDCGGNKING